MHQVGPFNTTSTDDVSRVVFPRQTTPPSLPPRLTVHWSICLNNHLWWRLSFESTKTALLFFITNLVPSFVDKSNFYSTLAFAFTANNKIAIWLGGLLVLLMIIGLSIFQVLKSIAEVPCIFSSTNGVFFITSLR